MHWGGGALRDYVAAHVIHEGRARDGVESVSSRSLSVCCSRQLQGSGIVGYTPNESQRQVCAARRRGGRKWAGTAARQAVLRPALLFMCFLERGAR